tara:strand:+ start:1563 stop:2609 length:1047 start_codon:yes stop_codon:yes gene_type:complete
MKVNISQNNYLDIINLKYGVFQPLNKFVSKKEFVSIVEDFKLDKNKFFPIPIYMGISKAVFNKIKFQKKIEAYYKSKKICNLKILSFYQINKKKIGKKIFQTSDGRHPGLQNFFRSGDYFIDCKIENFKKSSISKIQFNKPEIFKKKFSKFKKVIGFHTRNVPHRAHEWIHFFGLSKCDALLIQPLVGQFKSSEYKEDIIIKSNLKLVNKIYKKKNIFFNVFNSYPRYGGPREALLHALVRKNFGCTHFLVGRDHAGVKNYYPKYASQKLCKKFSNKININIVTFKEPYLCKGCLQIMNKKCSSCKNKKKETISGTKIRKLILNKKTIPQKYMRKEMSVLLDKNSIIA